MGHYKYGNSISEFVKRYRKEFKLSQWDLADMLGCSAQYISNVERGRHLVPASFGIMFADVLSAERKKYFMDLLSQAAADKTARDFKNKTKKKSIRRRNKD